jgi:hypothetical protein
VCCVACIRPTAASRSRSRKTLMGRQDTMPLHGTDRRRHRSPKGHGAGPSNRRARRKRPRPNHTCPPPMPSRRRRPRQCRTLPLSTRFLSPHCSPHSACRVREAGRHGSACFAGRPATSGDVAAKATQRGGRDAPAPFDLPHTP